MKTKLISIILCASVLLSLCACAGTGPRGTVTPSSTPEPSSAPAEAEGPAVGDKTYFPDDIWRGDYKYSTTDYEHYEREWLDEYLDPIYALAENGGTAEEFDEADFNLTDELYYINTLLTMMSLRQSSDPDNEKVADELLYAQEMYYTANDEYWNAMHAMAVSPHAELMETVYHPDYIAAFRDYEPSEDDSELEAYSAENELINEYYRLMAQPEIDYDAVGQVFIDLVQLRRAKADGVWYDSYADYAYDMMYSKDYTPDDAQAVWRGVKEYIVPVMAQYGAQVQDEVELLMSSNAVDYSKIGRAHV